MTPIPLCIDQGADFEYEFFVNDGAKSPSAIDITDRAYKSQMRDTASGPLIAEFTMALLDQTKPETKGRVSMTLDHAKTSSLRPGVYVYDVFQIIDGQAIKVFKGTATVDAAVTRL